MGVVGVQPGPLCGGGPGLETPGEAAAWDALRAQVRNNVRPVASPSTIGLFDLAAATFVVSGLQLSWVPESQGKQVALVGVTAAMSKVAPAVVFLTASLRFGLTAVYDLSADSGWKQAAGTVGLVLAALAVCVGWAHGAGGSSPPLSPNSTGQRAHELATAIGECP